MQGDTVLITGAARRLGCATAEAFAAQGANVVVHYHHSDEDAVSLVNSLHDTGVKG